jgi:hypothetical protein
MAQKQTDEIDGDLDLHGDEDFAVATKVSPKETKVTGERKTIKHQATKESVSLVFMQNRKFDLHVGREVVVFNGREQKPIPREWLDHPDFLQVRNYFVVKGVN